MPSTLVPARRRLLTTLASAAGLCLVAGCAVPADALAASGLATLEIFDRDAGQVIPLYGKDGRQFAPGRPGARYALRLRNLTDARILVVLSVDGINVISGATADWRQVGYVLDPWRSYDISGWRKSDTEIAAFEFAPIERSYAALTGRPDNVGVIGMAVFRERYVPPPPPPAPISMAPPVRSDKSTSAAAGALAEAPAALMKDKRAENSATDAAAPAQRLGTAHGQREWSVTSRTAFERASWTPNQVVQIEYDSRERLVAAGIIPDGYAIARPRPFPTNPGYVPDPPQR